MKVTASIAGALVGAALLSLTAPATAAEKKPANSPKVAAALKPAQEAMQAKKWQEALAKIKEAQAVPDKNPYDVYVIHEFGCQSNLGAQNLAEAAKECEAWLQDTQYVGESEKPKLIKMLLALNYQLKNYDKAIDYGQQAIKGGFATEEDKNTVAQAYYLKGDWKNAYKSEDALIDQEIKAGQTPKEQQLALVLNSCIKLDDKACQEHTVERLVAYYPKPDYWQQLLFTVLHDASGNDTNTMETYRLMFEVDVLKTAADYNEMAQMALEQGSPGEAVKVLEKGFSANVFTEQRAKERNTRLLETSKKTASTDQASLAKIGAEADKSATGAKDAGVGLAYLGYAQYDNAIQWFQKALTKGGLRNEADTRLLLGIAQYKGGHKDDALKTWKTVKGDPVLERLASLWAVHAKQG
jgi:tetratricopeptide (TPR) repeat protein